jgi:hypothetical protein
MQRRAKKTLKIDRDVAIRILRDLETMVVSLDRIGSAFAENRRAYDRATAAFVDDWWIFGKLAGIRHSLSDLFSDKLGPDGMDELEREVQDVPYWSERHPKPSRNCAKRKKRASSLKHDSF